MGEGGACIHQPSSMPVAKYSEKPSLLDPLKAKASALLMEDDFFFLNNNEINPAKRLLD